MKQTYLERAWGDSTDQVCSKQPVFRMKQCESVFRKERVLYVYATPRSFPEPTGSSPLGREGAPFRLAGTLQRVRQQRRRTATRPSGAAAARPLSSPPPHLSTWGTPSEPRREHRAERSGPRASTPRSVRRGARMNGPNLSPFGACVRPRGPERRHAVVRFPAGGARSPWGSPPALHTGRAPPGSPPDVHVCGATVDLVRHVPSLKSLRACNTAMHLGSAWLVCLEFTTFYTFLNTESEDPPLAAVFFFLVCAFHHSASAESPRTRASGRVLMEIPAYGPLSFRSLEGPV
ncbi:hypothetical protein HPB47_001382 [Ixodes persulcatus]|uniref:Uncharacterized protein n=1 Tax=Ixodes persulcatus TaxID=34615 RepID=A0AC60PPY4_IXOPE|nr:hypothetical protein HPB47_001382 [Ixodes persulcatus]